MKTPVHRNLHQALKEAIQADRDEAMNLMAMVLKSNNVKIVVNNEFAFFQTHKIECGFTTGYQGIKYDTIKTPDYEEEDIKMEEVIVKLEQEPEQKFVPQQQQQEPEQNSIPQQQQNSSLLEELGQQEVISNEIGLKKSNGTSITGSRLNKEGGVGIIGSALSLISKKRVKQSTIRSTSADYFKHVKFICDRCFERPLAKYRLNTPEAIEIYTTLQHFLRTETLVKEITSLHLDVMVALVLKQIALDATTHVGIGNIIKEIQTIRYRVPKNIDCDMNIIIERISFYYECLVCQVVSRSYSNMGAQARQDMIRMGSVPDDFWRRMKIGKNCQTYIQRYGAISLFVGDIIPREFYNCSKQTCREYIGTLDNTGIMREFREIDTSSLSKLFDTVPNLLETINFDKICNRKFNKFYW